MKPRADRRARHGLRRTRVSLDEIPGYLADIRARAARRRRAVLDEITESYRAIGGSLLLLEVTRRQVDALAEELGDGYRCYLGMRHWAPWIEEVVGEMVDDGVTRAVSLVLAPHFSALSVARYQQKVADGLELYRGRIGFEHVASYHDAPWPRGGVRELASRTGSRAGPRRSASACTSSSARTACRNAPSTQGDPYGGQCLETARLVATRAGLSGTTAGRGAYQSAGRTPEPWARPGPRRAPPGARPGAGRAGRRRRPRRLRLRPRGAPVRRRSSRPRAVAAELGMRLERPPALNDDPVFVAALAKLVRGSRAAGADEVARGVKVVVVGGGIAGLAAARRLEALAPWCPAGYRGSEREHVLGGKLLTECVDGFVVEGGTRQLPRAQGARRRALRGARAGRRAHRPQSRRTCRVFVLRGTELIPLPEGFTGMTRANLDALADSKLLSREGRERLAAEVDIPPAAPG